MAVNENVFMKRIELDLLKLKGGIFENTPRKDFFIKHTRGYVESILEQRDKDDYIQDPETGRMQGRMPSRSDESGLTEGSGSDKISSRPKSMRIGIKERTRISHQIASEYPDLKAGDEIHCYSNRNHFYQFSVNGFESYTFHYKISIDGNEEIISMIRRGDL